MAADDYTVGYGKPPLHSRFEKGRSGNPKGRPRKMPDFDAGEVDKLLDQTGGTLRIGGRERRITVREAIARTLIRNAAQGDLRAASQLFADELRLLQRVTGRRPPKHHDDEQGGVLVVPVVPEEDEAEYRELAIQSQRKLMEETFAAAGLYDQVQASS